jgi:hypothetical protein
MERELESIFQDLEDGLIPTFDQIDILRYHCGLKVYPRTILNDVFKDFGTIYGASK